ncbi:MAG: discoidin domain-containing protein [Pseudomonadota bacterium]
MPDGKPQSKMPAADLTGDHDDPSRSSEGLTRSSAPLYARMTAAAGRLSLWCIKKAAYVIFIIATVILLLMGLEKAAEVALKKSGFGYVYPDAPTMAKRDFTRPVSHYDYDLNPGVCLVYNQGKGNRYEYANNAGFRDPRPISIQKPADEYRVFLTGGSTAFGLGAAGRAAQVTNNYYLEHRETIAYQLERILNASAPPAGKKVKVYNTAIWGYSYQNLLFRYVAKLRRYKPDLIVSLDGVNEIHAVSVPTTDWNYFELGQFNGILRQIFAYNEPGLASYATLWLKNNTFLMAFVWRGTDPFFSMEAGMKAHQGAARPAESARGAQDFEPEERSRMVARNTAEVVRVLEDYHSVLENDGVPHIFAMQPMLHLGKKQRHDMEKQIESLDEHKQYYDLAVDDVYRFIIEEIRESAQKKKYFVADFSEYFDDTSQWVFSDWCHPTAGANYLIAKELAGLIKAHVLGMPLSEGDKVQDKDAFFRDPAVAADVVYAPPARDEAVGPKNILNGYPGLKPYISKDVSPNEKLELVLDLKNSYALGRLRVVWDESPVPEEWTVEVSDDGLAWKPWVRGTDKDTDKLSWWPGYEHFGAEPVHARYLRYAPVKTATRSISLRCLSVSR